MPRVQTSVVHLIRNCMLYASWKDINLIELLLREIYTATPSRPPRQALDTFADSDVSRSCPAAVDAWRRA